MLKSAGFENGAEDLKIGDGAGVAIRVSKQLTEKLKGTASGSRVEIGSTEKYETRGSLGLVFDNGNGSWSAFAEGFALHNSVAHPNSKWGATVGTSLPVGPGEVAVEYSYLEKAAQEVALAYNLPLGADPTLSPEIRYIDHENAATQDGTRVGVRVKAEFGPDEKQKQN